MGTFIRWVLSALLCMSIVTADAQLQGQLLTDSLISELGNVKEDTNKVKLLNKVCESFGFSNPKEGLVYGRQGVELSERLGWKKGKALSKNSLGMNCLLMGDYAFALKYFDSAISVYRALGEELKVLELYNNIGRVHLSTGDYPKALEFFLKVQNAPSIPEYEEVLSKAIGNTGNIYFYMYDYDKALEFYLKVLELNKKIGNKHSEATNNLNIGIVYFEGMADYEKALEYYQNSYILFKENSDGIGAVHVAVRIGMVYRELKRYGAAASYMMASMKMAREGGFRSEEAYALGNLGALYVHMAEEGASIQDLSAMEHDYNTSISELVPGFRLPEGKRALLSEAIDILQKAVVLMGELNRPVDLVPCNKALSEAYKLKGDYKNAFEASEHFHATKDSLYSQENKEEILRMSMKNDYDRQRLTDSLKVAEHQKIARINLKKQKSYTYAGIAGVLLLGGFSFFVFKERRKSEAERKKSDGLLLNILPETVAEELKAKGITSARHYDDVTVLFTDFVNFTQASESMSPQALIDELHTCFKKFDEISEQYNIEKIKTIGDAYLAVAGLPAADPEHALHVVSAAKEITEFMTDRLAKLGSERTFEVRVGIHSGSVVAGVVGVKKFAYDIWGDTVNTAARMEQNSEAGKINISQTTYELVKGKITCAYRGEVEVKGKGGMKMYYLSTGTPA